MKHWIFGLLVVLTLGGCKEKETMIEIVTDYGTMKAKLYNSTPKHRDNMVNDSVLPDDRGRILRWAHLSQGDPELHDPGW